MELLFFQITSRSVLSGAKPLNVPCYLNNFRDLIGVLNKSRWFSVLDLKVAYHQIGVTPDTSRKFGIITHMGNFNFMTLPFGAVNMHLLFFHNSLLIYYHEMEGYSPTWMIFYFIMKTYKTILRR